MPRETWRSSQEDETFVRVSIEEKPAWSPYWGKLLIEMTTVVLRLLNQSEPFSLGERKEWVQISIGEQNLDEPDSDSDEDDSDFAVAMQSRRC